MIRFGPAIGQKSAQQAQPDRTPGGRTIYRSTLLGNLDSTFGGEGKCSGARLGHQGAPVVGFNDYGARRFGGT